MTPSLHNLKKNRLAPFKSLKLSPSVSKEEVGQLFISNSTFRIGIAYQLDHVVDAAGGVPDATDIGAQNSGNYECASSP